MQYYIKGKHINIRFAELSGLPQDLVGQDATEATRKVPIMRKHVNLTLKRGYVSSEKPRKALIKLIDKPKHLTITEINESGEEVMTWYVQRAFPVKLESVEFNAEANEVLIESMELCCEGLSLDGNARTDC